MCDDDDNDFELAYTNEVTIDGKRSPQGKWLAYELKRSGPELGRIWLGLAGSSLGWCASTWVGARGLAVHVIGLCARGLGRSCLGLLRLGWCDLGSSLTGLAGVKASQREKKEERKEEEKKRRERKNGEEREEKDKSLGGVSIFQKKKIDFECFKIKF